MKSVCEFRRGVFPEGAKAEPVLQLGCMPAAILLSGEIIIDGFRPRIDLFSDNETSAAGGRPLVRNGRPGWRR